jgi:hypothetical protein
VKKRNLEELFDSGSEDSVALPIDDVFLNLLSHLDNINVNKTNKINVLFGVINYLLGSL